MNTKTLSPQALKIIENYLHLPFKNQDINCPYFNNRRSRVHGGLRVILGKGNPQEITEEVKLLALREKVDLKNLDNDSLKKFMVDHNIGVDCSGLTFHVLNAEFNGELKKHLTFPDLNFLRKMIAKFRLAENTRVKTLIASSKKISLKNVKPGDIIIITDFGPKKDRHHVMTIHQVDYKNNKPMIIHYTHSFEWSTDGKYNHGVRQGKIEIVDHELDILNQDWIEQGKTGKNNETYQQASQSKTKIKRIKK